MTPATHPLWSTAAKGLKRRGRENLLLESAALARGLSTVRVGSRAFIAADEAHDQRIGFHQTLSLKSSRAAVRAWEDRLLRREHLRAADLPLPASQRVSLEDTDEIRRIAAGWEHGALLKPVIRAAGALTRRPTEGEDPLDHDIARWQDRARPATQFLVEQRITGREYHFLVAENQVASVIRRRGRRWGAEIWRADEPSSTVHPEVLDLAVRTLAALPQSGHGVVRMICPSPATGTEGCVVVSAGPDVAFVGPRVPREWSIRTADALVGAAVGWAGVNGASGEDRHIRFTLTDVLAPEQLARALQDHATLREFTLDVDALDSQTLGGSVQAAPQELALLSGLLTTRRLAGEVPQTVRFDQDGG